MSGDNDAERVGEPGVRIDAAQLAGFDQRGDDGPVLGASVMTGEERILPVQRNRTDCPLNGIVVDLNAAIGQEQLEPVPVFCDVAQCFAEGRFRGEPPTSLPLSRLFSRM